MSVEDFWPFRFEEDFDEWQARLEQEVKQHVSLVLAGGDVHVIQTLKKFGRCDVAMEGSWSLRTLRMNVVEGCVVIGRCCFERSASLPLEEL